MGEVAVDEWFEIVVTPGTPIVSFAGTCRLPARFQIGRSRSRTDGKTEAVLEFAVSDGTISVVGRRSGGGRLVGNDDLLNPRQVLDAVVWPLATHEWKDDGTHKAVRHHDITTPKGRGAIEKRSRAAAVIQAAVETALATHYQSNNGRLLTQELAQRVVRVARHAEDAGITVSRALVDEFPDRCSDTAAARRLLHRARRLAGP